MNWLVKWFIKNKLSKLLTNGLEALQTKKNISELVANIRLWQTTIKRWYLSCDALLASALSKAEDGTITDDEVVEMMSDGKVFIADLTK